MTLVRNDGEDITPSTLEVRLLLALLTSPNNAYQIARRAEFDAQTDLKISAGTYQPALKRLERIGLIRFQPTGLYEITDGGQFILDQELVRYQRFNTLARQRRRA